MPTKWDCPATMVPTLFEPLVVGPATTKRGFAYTIEAFSGTDRPRTKTNPIANTSPAAERAVEKGQRRTTSFHPRFGQKNTLAKKPARVFLLLGPGPNRETSRSLIPPAPAASVGHSRFGNGRGRSYRAPTERRHMRGNLMARRRTRSEQTRCPRTFRRRTTTYGEH